MADEHFVVMTVECQHCKPSRRFILLSTDGAQWGTRQFNASLQQSFQGNDP